ncbi:hypothetical protein C7H19_06255 [Aphanothece hegewaldii CCALA 016]|uniref:Uncharacterized protein n=1 Tax=Aphanothece hegewaldii CCALA 016 TaxID=2107694 RepID=A0A2T1M065_9CHRO|nr:hypothetical protein [Aphanothece hegewaldii]PSF38071.1 hypothetical protein C7H19_06255 [Aphanothece hegewaldii CCALA 016]
MQKVSLLILISILGFLSGNQTISAQSSTPRSSFDDYRKECLQQATQQGLATDSANDLCNCTMTKIRSQYTIQQFQTLVQKSKTDRATAQRLSSIGESCLDSVLYE